MALPDNEELFDGPYPRRSPRSRSVPAAEVGAGGTDPAFARIFGTGAVVMQPSHTRHGYARRATEGAGGQITVTEELINLPEQIDAALREAEEHDEGDDYDEAFQTIQHNASVAIHEARREALKAKEEAERTVKAKEIEYGQRIDELEAELWLLRDSHTTPAAVPKEATKRRRGPPKRRASERAAELEKVKEELDEHTCLVCLEPLKGLERGCLRPCNHARYHYDCAMELFKKHGTCANNCKTAVTTVHKVIL